MSQRPVSYAGKRIAPSRRSVPPRKAPSRPTPRPDRTKSAAAPVPGVRRRMAQLVISAALLDLLGADTDFVEVFSAAGRAFADGSTVSDALNDAYTAVFGTSEIPAAPAVSRSETLPDNVEMLQRVLDFDYVDPVAAGQITSLFGCRSDPLEGDGRFHYGLDIAGEEGAVIRAFADGTVTAIGSSTDLGSYVTVTHAGGFSTLYAHCRKITASDGQQVRVGDPIAEMGDTGRATGFQLHFVFLVDVTFLNPIFYVSFA